MTSQIFLKAIMPLLRQYQSEFDWHYRWPRHCAIFKEKIIPAVAEKLDLRYGAEYWCLDYVFFKKKDPAFDEGVYADRLTVTIEHENNGVSAKHEIKMMSERVADLRVLITYYPKNAIKHTRESFLKVWKEIIQRSGLADTDRTFLVILGSRKDNMTEWEAWQYGMDEFEMVKE
jgi:hypothetical protein